ncbi:bcl-2-like protein 1 [Pristis pectinata]|uniref:bcl-2-like protein 1 n=1 Tax=Pristis pectinata TaxID=685728 RepID=UPI00223CB25B|nr:bcl-2-like protein 1 [Pristis pectinata]
MCSSRELVTDFLRYRLQQRGHSWSRLCEQDGAAGPDGGVAAAAGPEAERTCQALREAAEEFELRYRRAFSDLSAQLRVTPDTVYRRFEQVVGELFRDGVNWGRLVAFFCFGAALCVESAEKEMGALVPRIAHWMSTYLESNLEPWIQQEGGWDAFVVLYGNNAAARNRELQEMALKWFMAVMAVGATLAFAVYLARRR